jgi:hypothetical protein
VLLEGGGLNVEIVIMLQGEVKIVLLCARWIAALSCQLCSRCPSVADLFRLFSLTILFPFFAIIPPWCRDGGAEATETSGSLNELGEGGLECGLVITGRVTLVVVDCGCHRNCLVVSQKM